MKRSVILTYIIISVFCFGQTSDNFIYLAKDYISLFSETYNHPDSLSKSQENGIAVIGYDKKKNELSEISFFHEDGKIINITSYPETLSYKNREYVKVYLDDNFEYSMSKYLCSLIETKGEFQSNLDRIIIDKNKIFYNDDEMIIKLDTGGGYNQLRQTMLKNKDTKKGKPLLAINVKESQIDITNLKYGDGPVAVIDGKTRVFIRVK
jgi:hypothetical protein